MSETIQRAFIAQPRYSARSAPNAAVVITLQQATIRGRYVIGTISWSYSAAPAGGRLTIAGGGFNKAWDIIAGGQGYMPIEEKSDGTSDIVITLAAGGGVIVGELNLHDVRVD